MEPGVLKASSQKVMTEKVMDMLPSAWDIVNM